MWNQMRTVVKSFRYALKGFLYAFRNEQNFRIQTIAAVGVLLAALFFRVKPWEAVALTGMVVAVLVLEIANTVIERFIDLLKPRMEHYSGVIKDLMATAVLLTAFGSSVVGLIIFVPYIVSFLRDFMV